VVVLGLLLLVISGALIAGMVVQNTDAAHASVFGQALSGLTLGSLFAAGALTGAVALFGLLLMLSGARRRRARRVGLKRQVRDVRDERENLAEENARLKSELDSSRRTAGQPMADAPAYPSDTAAYSTDTPAHRGFGRHADTGRTDRDGLVQR
jgi:hypothetical protein